MGVFQKWGYPNSWMVYLVYFMENLSLKWMRTRGTPISGNAQMEVSQTGDPKVTMVVSVPSHGLLTWMIWGYFHFRTAPNI